MGLDGKNRYSIDYNCAQEFYPDGVFKSGILQNEYGPAFLTSNESLRELIPVYGRVGNGDVLTVAASGDQPLFYAAHGAKRIDTFDMTYNAKVIMDIKVAAMKQMSYDEYVQFIKNIAVSQPRYVTPRDLMTVDGMVQVVEKMPMRSAEYLRQMSGCNIFSSGVNRLNFPTADEYAKMQANVKQPFDFVWTDIANLRIFISNEKYDVINISNILEWVDNVYKGRDIISELFYSLKPNGYIIASAFKPRTGPTADVMQLFWEWHMGRAYIDSMYTSHEVIFTLQRTR